MEQGYHTPVLLEESVGLLSVDPAGTYVDLTFGGGGHSRRILSPGRAVHLGKRHQEPGLL